MHLFRRNMFVAYQNEAGDNCFFPKHFLCVLVLRGNIFFNLWPIE